MSPQILTPVASRDAVRQPDGTFRAIGPDSQILLSACASAGPWPAGWYAISLDGLTLEPHAYPMLLLRTCAASRGLIEFPFNIPSDRPVTALLKTENPFDEIRIAGFAPGSRIALAHATLRRLSRVHIAWRAFGAAPTEALAAAGWRLVGKKLRAKNRLKRLLAPLPGIDHAAWLERHPDMANRIALDASRSGDGAVVLIADGAPAFDHIGDVLACTSQRFIAVLPKGSEMTADAAEAVAVEARGNPQACVITWDHDGIDAEGLLRQPRFKPHWNHTYYLAYDYIGPAVAFRRDLLERFAERAIDTAGTWRTELLLAAARSDTTAIRHIPRILTHHPIGNDQQAAGALARRAFHVQSHLNALRDTAAVTATPFGHLRLTRVLPTPAPKVSVIVPTRDRLDLLRPCIEGLRSRTDYPDFEILIADNGSTDTATRAYLVALGSDARVRIIDAHGPFNFSAINNRAVEAARGAVLCFLNNDIEVRGSGWLAELVAWASLPSVGAVGAKLLYATGTIQHAGIVVGLGGLAGHPHRFFPADHPGYMGRLVVPQEVSAVTAACLAVRREAFQSVGGFDAEAFPVAFNDVDLCLRLAARGLVNIWTPEAVLTHKETASRPRDFSRRRRAAWLAEAQALRERWGSVIANDPCYSPSLTREREDMTPG